MVRHATPEAFLARASEWLARAEAEHNLFFGLCAGLTAHPEPASGFYLLTVEDDGTVVAAALKTADRKWVLSRAEPEAVAALVEGLRERGWPVPGVLGPVEAARAFAERWRQPFRRGKAQRIYELRGVLPPTPVAGRPRPATAGDLEIAAAWGRAFAHDAGTDETPEETAALSGRALEEGRLYLWDDGGPVAMAAVTRPTPHGIVVSFVYTPPEQRRRGYASALVAAVSDRMLANGKRFCCLFTDLANPTPNDIYQRIGYRPVADWVDYFFSAPA